MIGSADSLALPKAAIEQLRFCLPRLANEILDAIERKDRDAIKAFGTRQTTYLVLYLQRTDLQGRSIYSVLSECSEQLPEKFQELCEGKDPEGSMEDIIPALYTKMEIGRVNTGATIIRICSIGVL